MSTQPPNPDVPGVPPTPSTPPAHPGDAYAAPANAAPGYPAPAYPAPGYPGAGAVGPQRAAKGPSTLGLVAFLVGLLGVIVGSILVYMGGVTLGEIAQFTDPVTGAARPDADPAEVQRIAAAGAVPILWGWFIYIALGLWALIQGIIAIVKNRGRVLGIFALVFAVLGFIVLLIAMTIGTVVGAVPYIPVTG